MYSRSFPVTSPSSRAGLSSSTYRSSLPITSHRSIASPNWSSLSHLSRLSLSLTLLLLMTATLCSGKILRGVTIKSSPFVDTENNRFTGLCVDLMEEIKEITGLNYSLYLVEDGTYGPGMSVLNGVPRGLVGDVVNQKAEFAIADLTVTAFRSQYVQFTVPFFTFSFSALLRRELAQNMRTLDDLAIKSNLTIGTYMAGNTLKNLQALSPAIRTVRWLYNRTGSTDRNMVRSEREALDKIRTERYAFIQEEPKNSFLARKDCSLKVLNDPNYYLPGEYAIAFRKGSPFIHQFNQAIAKLDKSGTLAKLKKKYFSNYCSNGLMTVANLLTVGFALLFTLIFNHKSLLL